MVIIWYTALHLEKKCAKLCIFEKFPCVVSTPEGWTGHKPTSLLSFMFCLMLVHFQRRTQWVTRNYTPVNKHSHRKTQFLWDLLNQDRGIFHDYVSLPVYQGYSHRFIIFQINPSKDYFPRLTKPHLRPSTQGTFFLSSFLDFHEKVIQISLYQSARSLWEYIYYHSA